MASSAEPVGINLFDAANAYSDACRGRAGAYGRRGREPRGALLEHAEANGIGFIPWFPLATGKLASPGGSGPEPPSQHPRARRGAYFRDFFLAGRRETSRILWQRALDRGEARPEIDADTAGDVLFGGLIFRLMSGHVPLTRERADAMSQAALRGLLAHPT